MNVGSKILLILILLLNVGCGIMWSGVHRLTSSTQLPSTSPTPAPTATPTPTPTPTPTATPTPTPAPQYNYFLYVCGQDNTTPVVGYSMDHTTGQLTPIPGTLPTNFYCTSASAFSFPSSDQFIYFANDSAARQVNKQTGELTLTSLTTPAQVWLPVFDVLSRFLFGQDTGAGTTNFSYALNSNDTFGAANGPYSLTGGGGSYQNYYETPDGNYIYYVDPSDKDFSAFSIQANGVLTPISVTWPTGCGATADFDVSMISDPASKFLYFGCSNGTHTSIYPYQISAGSLIARTKITGLGQNQGMAIDGSGQFLYIQKSGTGQIKRYTIGSDGSLTSGVTASSDNGYYPTFDPTYTFIASVDGGGDTYISKIDGSGNLTPAPNSGLNGGGTSATTDPTFDPDGDFVFSANTIDGSISGFKVDRSNGNLTPITGVSPLTTMSAPGQIIILKELVP